MLGSVDLLKTPGVRLLTVRQLLVYLSKVERDIGAT